MFCDGAPCLHASKCIDDEIAVGSIMAILSGIESLAIISCSKIINVLYFISNHTLSYYPDIMHRLFIVANTGYMQSVQKQ